jgi:hypothetical protein
LHSHDFGEEIMDLTWCASLVAAAWTAAAVGTLLWRLFAPRWTVSDVLLAPRFWQAAGVTGGIGALAVGVCVMCKIGPRFPSEIATAAAPDGTQRPALHLPLPTRPFDLKRDAGFAEQASSSGKLAPELRVEGWLNLGGDGPPDVANRVYVMHLCPGWYGVCRDAPASLFETYRTYGDQVTFIGLTFGSRDIGEEIIAKSDLPWALGYGAGETALALYEFDATVFVVGADGRIAWHDGLALQRHNLDELPALVAKALDEAIEASQA